MNNLGFFRVLGFVAAALMVAAVALQATAADIHAVPESRTLQWVLSATSPETNKATTALATGHTGRALRLSHAAMTHVSTPPDRLILIHNLCLAHLTQGDIGGADAYCRAALLTSDNTLVASRRGGLMTVTDLPEPQAPALKLTTVIRANVATAYGAAAAESFASAVEAAAW